MQAYKKIWANVFGIRTDFECKKELCIEKQEDKRKKKPHLTKNLESFSKYLILQVNTKHIIIWKNNTKAML